MTKFEKFWKIKFRFQKKKFGSNTYTDIGPWFRSAIPKPNFGRTLTTCTWFLWPKTTRSEACIVYYVTKIFSKILCLGFSNVIINQKLGDKGQIVTILTAATTSPTPMCWKLKILKFPAKFGSNVKIELYPRLVKLGN